MIRIIMDLAPFLNTSACFITTEHWSILINDVFKLLKLYTGTAIVNEARADSPQLPDPQSTASKAYLANTGNMK
jgi:hypothetical protein